MKGRVVVCKEYGKPFVIEEYDVPEPDPGAVILRMTQAGVCGSDLHTYRHGMFLDLGTPVDSGRVLGHEFSGEVVDTGGGVSAVSRGDRVVSVGMGANAEYVRIPQQMTGTLLPFDDSISFVEAATTEPLATSLHAANLGDAQDGETHLIIGAGIIGLGILQCIKARSNAKTIVTYLSDKRLEKASELGADEIINAGRESLEQALLGDTALEDTLTEQNLLGKVSGAADTVYDCAGMGKNFTGPSVLSQALNVVKSNGKVVVVAVFEQDVTIDYNVVVRKGVQILGSWAWNMEEFVEASRLITQGIIDRKPLVSHTFGLEQASEAYETQLSAEEAIKVVFTP